MLVLFAAKSNGAYCAYSKTRQAPRPRQVRADRIKFARLKFAQPLLWPTLQPTFDFGGCAR
jgi:hypothetical protein